MTRKIIVIGAGVSGLAAAAYLAHRGFKVQVFEANDKVGGSSANTTQAGYTFNDGAMYLVMPALLDSVFESIGVKRETRLPLQRINPGSFSILPDGSSVTISPNLAVINKAGTSTVMHDDIQALLRRWQPVYDRFEQDLLQNPFSMWHFLKETWRFLPMFKGTVASELEKHISDRALRAALSGALLYLGLAPKDMPIFSILGLIAMLKQGFYLPIGGMGRIPEVLAKIVRAHGGEIHLNSPIRQIMLRNHKVFGVDVQDQGIVPADAVIATTSGMITYGHLMAANDVPAKLRRQAREAPLSHKAISLQLGLKKKIQAPAHSVNIIPWMEDQHEVFEPSTEKRRWLAYSVPTMTLPDLAPEGGSIIETYLPVPDQWQGIDVERFVGEALDILREHHELDIATQRIRTPAEFSTEMNLYDGALYGISPGAGFGSFFTHETSIVGLYQAGQTTYPGMGVVTSATSGILAAEQAVTQIQKPLGQSAGF